MPVASFWLDNETKELLNEMSKENEVSKSQLIKNLIHGKPYIRKEKSEKEKPRDFQPYTKSLGE